MKSPGAIRMKLIALLVLAAAAAAAATVEEGAPQEFEGLQQSSFLQSQREEKFSEETIRSLWDAYCALQEWKKVITKDPQGITKTWEGEYVCHYKGVFCSPSPSAKNASATCEQVVTGIDLNSGNITGTFPKQLGLLTHLVLFHVNSNFFTGTLPRSFRRLKRLYELDVSNNRLSGGYPTVTMSLPSLKYLDLRFNQFTGPLPTAIFSMQYDAFFVNSNNFTVSTTTLSNIGSNTASVIVLANNGLQGSIPDSIGKLNATLEEIILLGNSLTGCIPESVGNLTQLKVFDVGSNSLGGEVPASISYMKSLEQLNLANNLLSGDLPEGICELPKLLNLTISDNYITGVEDQCGALPSKRITFDDRDNCIPYEDDQKPLEQCFEFLCMPRSCNPRRIFPPPPYPMSPMPSPPSPSALPPSAAAAPY